MTSVQTYYSQKSTKRWVSTRGAYCYTYDLMKIVFDAYSPTYSGRSTVIFNSDSDIANAVAKLDIGALSTISTQGPTIFNDIGKDIRLGLRGGDSSMYTYRLVEVVNDPSGQGIAGFIVYVMIDQNPSVNVINLINTNYPSSEYGQVWVSRGY